MIKKLIPFILLLILIIPSFSALLRSGYFPMHDDMQAMRLLQIDKCVKDGQIPCRWVPDMGYGYGYPQFNYYPPMPYYVMEIFHLTGISILDSVKIGFILSVVISSFGMFLLGRELWGFDGGIISSLFYTYANYRAVDMYVRGAVGEFWALSFLPIIFWALIKVVGNKKGYVMWLSISLAALFTSHNITSMIFIPFVLLFALLMIFGNQQYSAYPIFKRVYKKLIFGFLWGFCLSAFFTLPAFLEKNLVHVETLRQGYFDYRAHFVSLRQLLFSNYWGYGSSELGPYDDLSISIGYLFWTLPIVATVLLLILRKKKAFLFTLFFMILGWLSLFMTHARSQFIWDNVNLLSYLQFPWRFLTVATFLFSAAIGSLGVLFPKSSRKFVLVVVLCLVLLLSNGRLFRPSKWLDMSDQEKFSGESWEKQLTISIFDYLPIYAEKPPGEKAPENAVFTSGAGRVIAKDLGTDWQKWSLEIFSESATVQLPLYYFPNWKVWLNESEVNIIHNNILGLVTFSADKGDAEVSAKLQNTPIRSFSNLLTFAGVLALPVYINRKRQYEN